MIWFRDFIVAPFIVGLALKTTFDSWEDIIVVTVKQITIFSSIVFLVFYYLTLAFYKHRKKIKNLSEEINEIKYGKPYVAYVPPQSSQFD